MAKVRRSVWVAGLVCVFLVSLAAFLSRQGRDEEKLRVRQAEKQTEGKDLNKESWAPDVRATEELSSLPAKVALRLSREPRLGETAEVIFTITPLEDVPQMKVIWGRPLKGVEIAGGEKVVYCSMRKGETRSFSVDVKFVSSPVHFGVSAGRWWHATKLEQEIYGLNEGDERFGLHTGASLRRVIIDEETGQFGVREELFQDPWWNFDPLLGRKCRVSQGDAKRNEKWIEDMRELEPSISDWEALYLCRDAMLYSPQSPGESLRVHQRKGWETILEKGKILFEKGWLEEFRKEDRTYPTDFPENLRKHLKWLKQLRNNSESSSEEDGAEKSEAMPPGIDTPTNFTGTWIYQKYPYDTTGLDSIPFDTPVRKGMVAIWGYPHDFPTDRRIRGRCHTEDDGTFDITVDLRAGVLWTIFEVVYPIGPNSTNALLASIKTSDPTGPYFGWKVPEDSSVWHYKADSTFWNLTPGLPHDFGTAYVDTMPPQQPRAGWINIYEALLQAYDHLVPTYTSPSEIGRVRAMWEPGYQTLTGGSYWVADTIYVAGDTLVDDDEWDDLNLIHEYGHHVMAHCAENPPDTTSAHAWWRSYPEDEPLAYDEGWPHSLISIVTDSVWYVDTKLGIGGGDAYYRSIENPWLCSAVPPDSFEGGPWCEGAVAGVLWDIYDSADELPYPTYAAPGWPDTGLADTLSLGFDETWHVFSTYDPALGAPERCWTIYHFLSGWTSPPYNYDHEGGLDQVLTHHRIPWDIPPAPSLLRAILVGTKNVLLSWLPGFLTPDSVLGYNMYRRELGSPEFVRIGSVTDTLFIDSTVVNGLTYFYTVTGLDSLQVESDTSNNAIVWVPGSEDSLATAYNNAQKIVWAEGDSTIYIAYSSDDRVYCEISTDFGATWSWSEVGEGAFPTIAPAPDGDLWMVWLGNYGWGTDSLFLAYRSIISSQYSAGSWSEPDTICTFNKGNDSLQCVSFSTDDQSPMGYGHVVATYMTDNMIISADPPDTIHCIESYLEYFRFPLDDSLSNVTRQVVTSASVGAPPPLITLASVAADTAGLPHIAWERWFPWDPVAHGPVHAILYKCGLSVSLGDSVVWDVATKTLSDLMVDSYYPYIEYDGYHDRTGVVWDADYEGTTTGFQVYSRFKTDTIWSPIKIVTWSAGDSRLPVVSGDYAVWSEWAIGGPAQIYKAKYDCVSGSWGLPDTLFISDEASMYAQTVLAHTPTDTLLFTCWTEGDSAPYLVAFDMDTVEGADFWGPYYVDAGRPVPSPCLVHRGGYQDWGAFPQLTADTDPQAVSYRFTSLDPKASYHLTTVHYFEPTKLAAKMPEAVLAESAFTSKIKYEAAQASPASVRAEDNLNPGLSVTIPPPVLDNSQSVFQTTEQSFGTAPGRNMALKDNVARNVEKVKENTPLSSPQLVMGIRLDGVPSGEVKFPPRSVVTFRCGVPQPSVADGVLTVEIARLTGKYALVSELYLCQVESRDAASVEAGAQFRSESGRKRFRFQGLSPNPSRGSVRLSYEIATQCDVSVDVFDVAGRLVRTISQSDRAPGTYALTWDCGADSGVLAPAGIYFVRLTARNRVSGAEEFLSTRKLVLVR